MESKQAEMIFYCVSLGLLSVLVGWLIYDGIESNKRDDKRLSLLENDQAIKEMELSATKRHFDNMSKRWETTDTDEKKGGKVVELVNFADKKEEETVKA